MNFSQSQVAFTGRASTQREHGSQRSAITAKKSSSYNEEENELSKKADECVQYILLCSLSERKAVVKRADLNKNVIKEYSRQYRTIIKMVEYRLEEVFGIELFQIDDVEIDKSEKIGLRNKFEFDVELNLPLARRIYSSDDTDQVFNDQFKYSMLMISLSLIFMNDNEIDANLFWDSMKKLGINKDEKKHKHLGDISKYFTSDLVKEGYLNYETVKGIEPPSYKFKAGYRSKLEITKHSLLEFVCNVYGGVDVCSPQEWSSQYADALKELNFGEQGEAIVEHMDVNSQSQRTQLRSQR